MAGRHLVDRPDTCLLSDAGCVWGLVVRPTARGPVSQFFKWVALHPMGKKPARRVDSTEQMPPDSLNRRILV